MLPGYGVPLPDTCQGGRGGMACQNGGRHVTPPKQPCAYGEASGFHAIAAGRCAARCGACPGRDGAQAARTMRVLWSNARCRARLLRELPLVREPATAAAILVPRPQDKDRRLYADGESSRPLRLGSQLRRRMTRLRANLAGVRSTA